jgi:hypothetical protein
MITFDHVALTVSDIQRSIRFYQEIFWGTVTQSHFWDLFSVAFLDLEWRSIEFFEFKTNVDTWVLESTMLDRIWCKHFACKSNNFDKTVQKIMDAWETHQQGLIREWKEECNATIIVWDQLVAYEHTNSVYGYQQHTTTYKFFLESSLTLTHEIRWMKWFSKKEIESWAYVFSIRSLNTILLE